MTRLVILQVVFGLCIEWVMSTFVNDMVLDLC